MPVAAGKAVSESLQLFLRVKHPGIDPDEISRTFDLHPEYANKAGVTVTASGVKKLYSESYWLASLPLRSIQEIALQISQKEPFSPTADSLSTRLRSLRLGHETGIAGMQVIFSLRTLDAQSGFIKRIIGEGGSVTLVLQRADRDVPFSVSPLLSRRLADLEIGLEID